MSPNRYRPSFEARPVLEGLPRTNVHTPGFLLSAGAGCLATGVLMLTFRPPSGEVDATTLAFYRAGAWTALIVGGILFLSAKFAFARARARAAASSSADAWKLDYSWTPGAARDRAVASACEALFWTILSLAVGAGGIVVARLHGVSDSPLVQVFSVVLAGVCAAGVYLSFGPLRRGALFGESRLTWMGELLRAGTDWEGEIEVVDGVTAPYAFLQFVKEAKIDAGENVRYERREHQRIELACRLGAGTRGNKVLRVSARIPKSAPATELSRDPARYWELFVADDASGWATAFLVPLYR